MATMQSCTKTWQDSNKWVQSLLWFCGRYLQEQSGFLSDSWDFYIRKQFVEQYLNDSKLCKLMIIIFFWKLTIWNLRSTEFHVIPIYIIIQYSQFSEAVFSIYEISILHLGPASVLEHASAINTVKITFHQILNHTAQLRLSSTHL